VVGWISKDSGRALREDVDAKDEIDMVSSGWGFGGYVAGLNSLCAIPDIPAVGGEVTSAKSAKWRDIGVHPLTRGEPELPDITEPGCELKPPELRAND